MEEVKLGDWDKVIGRGVDQKALLDTGVDYWAKRKYKAEKPNFLSQQRPIVIRDYLMMWWYKAVAFPKLFSTKNILKHLINKRETKIWVTLKSQNHTSLYSANLIPKQIRIWFTGIWESNHLSSSKRGSAASQSLEGSTLCSNSLTSSQRNQISKRAKEEDTTNKVWQDLSQFGISGGGKDDMFVEEIRDMEYIDLEGKKARKTKNSSCNVYHVIQYTWVRLLAEMKEIKRNDYQGPGGHGLHSKNKNNEC